ncbi:IolE/MocC family protein [Flindersiella endophytica]
MAGRVAGAPISWGVCEAPDWGYELTAQRVLAEMARLGLPATELGPTGYLGPDPLTVRETLAANDLSLVGGFLPVVLHTAEQADLTQAEYAMRTLADAGAEVVVLAADAGPAGYNEKVVLGDTQWRWLLSNLDRTRELAAELGLAASLHPHVGTAIEAADVVYRLLADSDVPLCLDTGHLAIGGADPLELVRKYADRVGHVHLKDVRLAVAQAVAEGTETFIDGVRSGLFVPLGDGDLDIAGIVRALEDSGYRGWYVLEQDATLDEVPEPWTGPIDDVRRSIAYLSQDSLAKV